MFTTAKGTGGSLFAVLLNLIESHPSAIIARGSSQAAARRMEDRLAQLPPHLRDDVGLSQIPFPEPEPPALARARRRASRWGS